MTRPADEDLAGVVRPTRLKRRPDFLRAAGGRKVHAAHFTVQAVDRPSGEDPATRVGFTVTKKVGNAVERNRIKRRLREVVRVTQDLGIKPSHDYVIVARRMALDKPFGELAGALRAAIGRLDRSQAFSGGPRRNRRTDAPRGEVRS